MAYASRAAATRSPCDPLSERDETMFAQGYSAQRARWVGVGVTIGIGASLVTTRMMADQLWNTPAFDLTTVGSTALVMVAWR